MNRWLMLLIATIGSLATMVTIVGQPASQTQATNLSFLGEPVTGQEIEAGRQLYAKNCAGCHGANLEGQPDWKRRLPSGRMPAPPHDQSGHTWHHSDQDLFAITKRGVAAIVPGYESDMPPFSEAMSDAEIRAVLVFIKSTWPERQRGYQAAVTAGDADGP